MLVGVLGMPVEGESKETKTGGSRPSTYISASAVRFVEAAGARVVPMLHTMSRKQIMKRFNAVNGVYVPDGEADVCAGAFAELVKFVLDLAKQTNQMGDYFPVWGGALGFQVMLVQLSGNCSMLSSFDADDIVAPFEFTNAADGSRVFGKGSEGWKQLRETMASASAAHMQGSDMGLLHEEWLHNTPLKSLFNLLALSVDMDGTKFVSVLESKKFPFYLSHWHTEKTSMEWTSGHLSVQSAKLTHDMAAVFAVDLERSIHRPSSMEDELDMVIYNSNPIYTYKTWSGMGFEQVYVFDEANSAGGTCRNP